MTDDDDTSDELFGSGAVETETEPETEPETETELEPSSEADTPSPEGADPPGARSRRRLMVPVLVAVALIAALGVGAFVMFSGDDSSGELEAVVTDFMEAGASGDCEAAVELIARSTVEDAGATPDELVALCEGTDEEVDELVSTVVVSEDDDRAVVATEVLLDDGETGTVVVELMEEDDEWRIDFASLSGVAAPPPDRSESGGATTTAPPTSEGDGGTETTAAGEAPDLEALRTGCTGGSMSDCDSLYNNTEVGSELETTAETCGGLDPGGSHQGNCEDDLGAEPLEELRTGCTDGSMSDCDTLYRSTPVGSDLETVAETCGGVDPTGSHQGNCEEDLG